MTKLTKTPARVARKMSPKEIAAAIKTALVERSGHNFRVTSTPTGIFIKPYSLAKRRELRDLMGLSAVPPAQFRISRPDTLLDHLRRAQVGR